MRRNMEEVYVMGHRLIAFYQHALPNHPDYSSSSASPRDIISKRERSRRDLAWIQNRLVVVSLRVDEEQLNRHVFQDLNQNQSSNDSIMPVDILQDLNNFATSEKVVKPNSAQETHWEQFSGWSPEVTSRELPWEPTYSETFEEKDKEDYQIMDEDDTHLISEEIDYEQPIYDTKALETSDFSFWLIEEESNENFPESIHEEEDDRHVVTPSPSRSPQNVFARLVSNVLLRNRSRRDPPGMYFSKINCFSSSKQQNYGTKQGNEWKKKELNEGETISTAPSDEDE
jgi:hypothetical protein